jgi:class 3 adenylate cyclase/predicted ATPase
MTLEELVDQVLAMLRRRGRVSYRTLIRDLALDEPHLEDLKEAILFAHPQVVDEAGRGLVWTGDAGVISPPAPESPQPAEQPVPPAPRDGQTAVPLSESQTPDAERRQLTVLFCDLVDSTVLATQLDPEELREMVRVYQETCAKVIVRFEGHIAQYLGDGLLVYFGYPFAHEDDAQRAVRAGLGMVEALGQLNTRLAQGRAAQLAVRLGIHTGLVVVGEVGGGTRQEQLALGETPNLAARLQGLAAPNSLVISAATLQLLGGFFACQALGTQLLKGFTQPMEVYQVLSESTARSRLDAAGSTGLTQLVGREQEVRLLLERWAQVKDGLGQVVLLSGEAGIGKSRLLQVLKEHVATEPQAWLTPSQCSPYYRNTALYPLIDLLERVTLHFDREESPQQKRGKLEGFLVQYGLPLAEGVPLFAALLSISLGTDYAPLNLSPQQQKQKTLQALLTILLRIAAQQPLLFIMEDLHWVDPTTLELLSLLVDQGPAARILVLLTFRPDFSPPWTGRSHLTQVTLPRLPRRQAVELVGRVAHGKALPPEVIEQLVAKTDGVPLFVEELTKMVLESGLLQEREERYELLGPLPPLAIPATLHDSLMARLDRLTTVKGLAQLGATLGREFSYELLRAVSPWDEETLRSGLHQLVEAEFLYQQGLPPQATYLFKHALIQDTAYQSLLRSTRQRHHQRIAQVLEEQFAEIAQTQPELLAHHYTEAGLRAQAIPYWQRAGERATKRSAYIEAIAHHTKGLELLAAMQATLERDQQELTFQLALGAALLATKGHAAPAVEHAYARAHALCQQMGETPQLHRALQGLFTFYLGKAEYQMTGKLGTELLERASGEAQQYVRLVAHRMLGTTVFYRGEFAAARDHFQHGITFYDLPQHGGLASQYGWDVGVYCRVYAAWTGWLLGYADQAVEHSQDARRLAHTLAHPFSVAAALNHAALIHLCRREDEMAQVQANDAVTLCTEQNFAFYVAMAHVLGGRAQAALGQGAAGIRQMRQGMRMWGETGAVILLPMFLGLLAEAYGMTGQPAEGLAVLTDARGTMERHGERWWEAELYRLQGELSLQQAVSTAPLPETCFQQALAIARRQQAKSWELRAAMSLSRLWQQQGKHAEARELLAPIHAWFTEGFDTADMREAKGLLEASS